MCEPQHITETIMLPPTPDSHLQTCVSALADITLHIFNQQEQFEMVFLNVLYFLKPLY